MSDHAINIALLIIGVVTCLFEAGIAWMILQDYRKVRGMPELSPKRLGLLSVLSLGPLLALLLLWLFATNIRPKSEVPGEQPVVMKSVVAVPTYLRLQFNAPTTLPVAVDKQNIWRWSATRINMGQFHAWFIAVTFDQPVSFQQIQIDGSGSTLPTYEVKDSSNRNIVAVFGGELTGIVLNIRATE